MTHNITQRFVLLMRTSTSMFEDLRSLTTSVEKGHLDEVFNIAESILQPLPEKVLSSLLRKCSKDDHIRRFWSLSIFKGRNSDAFLGFHLIRLFSSHEHLVEANQVFDRVAIPSVYTWSSVVLANAKLGQCKTSLDMYQRMQESGMYTDTFASVAVLQACSITATLIHGRLIHGQTIDDHLIMDDILENTLVHMYAKCGSLKEAYMLLHKLQNTDVVSWNLVISEYAQHENPLPAFDLFSTMQMRGISPNRVTFLGLLKASGNIATISQGRLIHSYVIASCLDLDAALANTLIDTYAKCGSVGEAHIVFNKLTNRDMILWNTMITRYLHHGELLPALELYQQMQEQNVSSDKATFLSALKICMNIGNIEQGKLIHNRIMHSGLGSDCVLASALVDMYAKCGSLEEAQEVFDKLPNRDLAMWNTLLGGYVQHGRGLQALELYAKMDEEGMKADKITFLSILKAGGSIKDRDKCVLIHRQLRSSGLGQDLAVGNTLIDTYAKCGDMLEACKIFANLSNRDLVSWNAMIAGYAQVGNGFLAFNCFKKMQEKDIRPDRVTFLCLLKACCSIGDLGFVDEQIIKSGLHLNGTLANCMVDMLAKCGNIEKARDVFSGLEKRDVVSWNIIISGYAQRGDGRIPLELFKEMEEEGIEPNRVTFLSSLKACGNAGAISHGKLIHNRIMKKGPQLDFVIESAIFDMYASCGSMDEANKVFHNLTNQDVASWNAIIGAYAQNGDAGFAITCLKSMQREVEPDESTFTSILVACSHAGLVEEGCQYFKSMREEHFIRPNKHHFACVVDLLGRSGRLQEAKMLLQTGGEPNIFGWTSLLSACRMHGDVELGRKCFYEMVHMDPHCTAGYVLMSNICVDAHMLDRKMSEMQKLQQRQLSVVI